MMVLSKCKQLFFALGLLLCSVACNDQDVIGKDPYAGGKEPFGVKFIGDAPVPASAPPGAEVLFSVRGLLKWQGQFDFLINNDKTEVVKLTDTTVTIRVPQNVASGIASIILNGQVFFGPRLTVEGNISIDVNFGVVQGANQPIYDYYAYSQQYMLVGAFTDFEHKAAWNVFYNRLAFINDQGILQTNFSNLRGANGPITSVSRLSNGSFIISGSFTNFNDKRGIQGITKLKPDGGTLDDQIINVINLTPNVPNNGKDTVSVFNGGVPEQNIIRSFITPDDKVIAVGSIRTYAKADYAKSTRLSRFYIYTNINTVLRMDEFGKLDSTYNWGNAGAEGTVTDACMQEDGEIVIVGNFTKYNGTTVNRIVRLDNNGNIDPSFQTGSGANGVINTIRYNPVVKKSMLTGTFTTFNNKAVNGVVMLNEDGSVDDQFKLRAMEGGVANFATVLNSHLVLVSGNFSRYDGITRPGFLLLNADGSVSQNFNVPGKFQGQIYQVAETQSALGNPALILMGYIQSFDDQRVGNIVRVEIKESN